MIGLGLGININKQGANSGLAGGAYNINGATAFDNSAQYVDIASIIPQVSSLRAWSMSFWVHSDEFSNGTQYITQIWDSVGDSRLDVRAISNGGVEAQFATSGGVQWRAVCLDKPINDQWNHFLITFDGVNDCKFYVNGLASGVTYTISTDKTLSFDSINAPDQWELGRRPNDGGFNLLGALVHYQVYNVELDAADAVSIFNNGLPKDERGRTGQVVNLRLGGGVDYSSLTEYGKSYRVHSVQSSYIDASAGISAISSHQTGSVSFWVRMDDSTPAAGQFLWNLGDTNASKRIGCFMQSNGRLRLQALNGSTDFALDVDAALTSNVMAHVVIVQDGVKPKIYIDNVEKTLIDSVITNTTVWFGDYAGLDNITLGTYIFNSAGAQLYADAVISNFLVTSSVLDSSDVTALYNAGVLSDVSGTTGAALYYSGVGDTYDGSNWTIVDAIGGNDAVSVRMNEVHQRIGSASSVDVTLTESVTGGSVTFEGGAPSSMATTNFTESTLPVIVYDGNSIPNFAREELEAGFTNEYGAPAANTYALHQIQVGGRTLTGMLDLFNDQAAGLIVGTKRNAYYFIHEIRNELAELDATAEETRDKVLQLAALAKSWNSNCKVIVIQASASNKSGGVLETDIPVVNAYFDSPQNNVDLVIDLYNYSDVNGSFDDVDSGLYQADKIHPNQDGQDAIGAFIPIQFKLEYNTL